jgi:hypothetical protein
LSTSKLWLVAHDVRVLDLPIRAVDELLRRITDVIQSDTSNDEGDEECQDYACYRPGIVPPPRVVPLWLIHGARA